MTFAVFYCNLHTFSNIRLSVTIMDNRTHNITKEGPPTSLSLNHNLLDSQSDWSRCNSFSSSSNDSSIFCTNHLQGSSITLGKRLANEAPSTRLPKRSRNSSGSSVSSNMSCISDKDTKKTSLIISNCVPNVSNHQTGIRTNVDGLSRLSCPDLSTSTFELKHEHLLNQHLSCSDTSGSMLPFRHNLRRNIRKKTCSCDCTATCTTVVVRRYNKIGKKTVKEETLISTKVETCSQNNSTQEVHNVSYEKSFSPSKADSNRRRRSEVEKLYDSLHEIEWAKNFSPDNILRQLNIRQAASVSMFGNSSKQKPTCSEVKANRKSKDSNADEARKPTYPKSQQESETPKSDELNSFVRRTRSKTRCLEQNSVPSFSEMNFSNGSSARNKHKNSHDCKKGKFAEKHSQNSRQSSSCKSDCSESSVESSFMGSSQTSISINSCPSDLLESPVLVSENYLQDYRNDLDDVPIPDITSDIKFFDIAEEGIRTIDACFREVGAEVVISTCYEVDSELPRLTPVKDNPSHKLPVESDSPPVLERCVSIQEQKYSQVHGCNSVINKSVYKGSFNNKSSIKRDGNTKPNNTSSLAINDKPNPSLEHSKHPKPINSSSINKSANRTLLVRAGKRILKKYLKFLHSRIKLQKLPLDKVDTLSKEVPTEKQELESSEVKCTSKSDDSLKENKIVLKSENSMSTKPSFSFKSHEINCQTIGESPRNTTILKTNQKLSYSSADGISFNHCKTKYLYATKNETENTPTAVQNVSGKALILQGNASSFSIHKPGPSTILSLKDKTEDDKYGKNISRPQKFNFACHYQSLRVYRYNGYSQVVLKLTRSNSIFLTVESLEELKDVMKKIGQDPQCHTFILMGCGNTFCSGLDLLPLLGPQKVKNSSEMAIAVKDFIIALSAFKKPIVVVVDGPAFGLGMTILTHADISIASDTATFCMPQSSLGFFPEGGATLTLPQAVGSTVAMDLILRSRTLTAREAKDVGLISEVVSAKELGMDLVSRVKTLAENSLACMETTKAMLKMRLLYELPMVLDNEIKLLPQMWLSQPCQEALRNALDSGSWIA